MFPIEQGLTPIPGDVIEKGAHCKAVRAGDEHIFFPNVWTGEAIHDHAVARPVDARCRLRMTCPDWLQGAGDQFLLDEGVLLCELRGTGAALDLVEPRGFGARCLYGHPQTQASHALGADA
jgi:hypothetical protein